MGDIHGGPSVVPSGPGGADDDLMTVYETASALSISKIAVYRLVECGELEWVRRGDSIRIRRGSINLPLHEAM